MLIFLKTFLLTSLIFFHWNASARCFLTVHNLHYVAEKVLELPLYSPSQVQTVINGYKLLKLIKGQKDLYVPLNQIDRYHPFGFFSQIKARHRYRQLRESRLDKHEQLDKIILNRVMPSATNIRVIELGPGKYIPFDGGGRILALKNAYQGRNPEIQVEVLKFAPEDMGEVYTLIREVQTNTRTTPYIVKPAKLLASTAMVTAAAGSLAAYLIYRHGFYQYYATIYDEKIEAEVMAHDLLLTPGQAAKLNIEVRRIALHGKKQIEKDVSIQAFINAVKVGEGKSDRRGLLELNLDKDFSPGTHTVTFKAEKDGHVYASGQAQITVIEQEKPIAIVDIDQALSTQQGRKFILGQNSENHAQAGSLQRLNQLQKDYQIIYLTHRSNLFMEKTNRWLKQEKFPKAPVIFSDYLSADSQDFILYSNAKLFTKRIIAEIEESFPLSPLKLIPSN